MATADAVEHNHGIQQKPDPISGLGAVEFVLGADTSFSLFSLVVGNTPLTPEAVTDTMTNIATVYYDVMRLKGSEPIWGLRQIKIVKPEGNPGYLEIIKPKHEEE